MKTVKINIDGQEFNARLNLASRIEVKRQFGKNMEELDYEDEEVIYQTMYAVLKANNQEFQYTFNEFLQVAPIGILISFSELFKSETPNTETEGNG